MIEAKKSSEKVFANTVIDLTRSGHWLEHRRLSQKLFLKKSTSRNDHCGHLNFRSGGLTGGSQMLFLKKV